MAIINTGRDKTVLTIGAALCAFCSLSLMAEVPNLSRTPIDDNAISASIRTKITQAKPLAKTKIRVTTKQGRVTISGFVQHDYQEDLVYKLAESTEGVTEVLGTEEPTRDSLITARIEGLLIRNHLLTNSDRQDHKLSITTDKGLVTITGSAADSLQEEKIITLAKSVRGVMTVVSHIRLTNTNPAICPVGKIPPQEVQKKMGLDKRPDQKVSKL